MFRLGEPTKVEASSVLSQRAEEIDLSKNIVSNDFRLKDFDCRATIFVGGGGGNGKQGASTPEGSKILLGWGVIAGATSIGEGGGVCTVTRESFKLSEEKVICLRMIVVFTMNPFSIIFEFESKTGG